MRVILLLLFREEVLQARERRVEGEVFLSLPSQTKAITFLILTIAVALSIWVWRGQYSRIESAKGILNTDVDAARIIALRPGIVSKLRVREGQFVSRGEVLAIVEMEQQYAEGLRAAGEELVATASQQRLALEQVRRSGDRGHSEQDGLLSTIESTQRQRRDVLNQAELQRRLVDSDQHILDRYRPIAERGFVSKIEIERREQELLSTQQGLSRLQQQLTVLDAEERKARADLSRSKADEAIQSSIAQSAVEGFKLQTSQIRSGRTYVLTAPYDGIVTGIQTGVGRTADPTIPMMTIMPRNAEVHADIYAPSRAVGLVQPGNEVRMLYEAFPYDRYGSFRGKIVQISQVALDPRQIDTALKFDEPVYKITVQPDVQSVSSSGRTIRLQPGMTLTANIVLERRSFVDWILAPVKNATRRTQ